jgi:thiamine pyrophosphokinase
LKRAVIVSGGALGSWVLDHLRTDDLLIGADRGALFLIEHGLQPTIALGDFDSISEMERHQVKLGSREMMAYDPIDKDWTDTELALRYALDQQPSAIVMLGALGTRFDHTLANVHLLNTALEHNVPCSLIDAHNAIQLIDRSCTIQRGRYPHVSLLPLSMTVTGITLRGFQYPLRDATLRIGQSLGISNVLLESSGDIEIKEGLLLVIQSSD